MNNVRESRATIYQVSCCNNTSCRCTNVLRFCRLLEPILYSLFWTLQTAADLDQSRYTCTAQVKGRQRSRNFGSDRLNGAKWGAKECQRRWGFFCKQYEMTFRQHRNGRFSPNLATTRESWVKRRFWTEIYEAFPFRGHLPQNPKLGGGQTGTSLRAGYRSRSALQRDTVYSTLCRCVYYKMSAT